MKKVCGAVLALLLSLGFAAVAFAGGGDPPPPTCTGRLCPPAVK